MDTKYFKQKLEEEKNRIEKYLSKIARPNPDNSGDWQTTAEDLNVMPADKTELADVFEEAANKEAIEIELEEQLDKIKTALQKIEEKKYGVCEVCRGKIEEKRLKANPTAETCIKHAK